MKLSISLLSIALLTSKALLASSSDSAELPPHQPSYSSPLTWPSDSQEAPEPPAIVRIVAVEHFKPDQKSQVSEKTWVAGVADVTMLFTDDSTQTQNGPLDCYVEKIQKQYRTCVEHKEIDPDQDSGTWLHLPRYRLWHGVKVYQQIAHYTFRLPENPQMTFEKELPMKQAAQADLQWTSDEPPSDCQHGVCKDYSQPMFSPETQ